MRAIMLAVALGLLSSSGVSAQQRGLVAGRVLDSDGRPWAGAVVQLAAHSVPQAPDVGTTDSVSAETNAAGVFRARLLPGREYAAFIAMPGEGDTRTRRSTVQRGVVPGAMVELREVASWPADARLQVTGGGKWGELAPRAVVLHHADRRVPSVRVELGDEGRALLPPFPEGRLWAVLEDATGEPRQAKFLWRLERSFRKPGGAVRIEVETLREMPVLVTDTEGEPIAGADLRVRVGRSWVSGEAEEPFDDYSEEVWRNGPKTDADGRAVLRVPLSFDPFGPVDQRRYEEVIVFASKSGFARKHAGLDGQKIYWNGEQVDESAGPVSELRIQLDSAQPLSARLLGVGGQPLADVPVVVHWTSKNRYESGWSHLPLRDVVRSGADGRFVLPDIPRDAYLVGLSFAVPEPVLQLEKFAGVVVPYATAMVPTDDRPERNGKLELGDLNLEALAPVRIQIRNANGTPRPRVPAVVFPVGGDRWSTPEAPWTLRTDSRGRLGILLPPGTYGVVAIADDATVEEILEVPAGGQSMQLDYAMKELEVMDLEFHGPDGKLLEVDGTVHERGASYGGGEDLTRPIRQLMRQMSSRYVGEAKVVQGKCRIRFREQASLRLRFEVRLADGRESEQLTLEATEQPRIVEIR